MWILAAFITALGTGGYALDSRHDDLGRSFAFVLCLITITVGVWLFHTGKDEL